MSNRDFYSSLLLMYIVLAWVQGSMAGPLGYFLVPTICALVAYGLVALWGGRKALTEEANIRRKVVFYIFLVFTALGIIGQVAPVD